MTSIQTLCCDREPPLDYGVLGNDGAPRRRGGRSDDVPGDPLMVETQEIIFDTQWKQPIFDWSAPLFHFSSSASLDLDIATGTTLRETNHVGILEITQSYDEWNDGPGHPFQIRDNDCAIAFSFTSDDDILLSPDSSPDFEFVSTDKSITNCSPNTPNMEAASPRISDGHPPTVRVFRQGLKRTSPDSCSDRLSLVDVRVIFEAVHGRRELSPDLKLQVVLGSDGPRISPPSFAYEEGLYIVTRPLPKNRGLSGDLQSLPSHLVDCLVRETSGVDCPWTVSGPQLRKPADFQQRYLSPKGNNQYSSCMGGTLWTMNDSDGREDLEYRLLHIYVSTKKRTKLRRR